MRGSGGDPDPIVLADDRPLTALAHSGRRPNHGKFWIRAIRLSGEEKPDPARYAACCFPAVYGPGIRSHYVINQDGVIYMKDLGHGNGIEIYPTDPLKEGWERVDTR